MKTITFLLASLFLSLGACSQVTPPKEVGTAFQKKFDQGSHVKWSRENDREWEAEFVLDGVKMSANFDNSGSWLETEKTLKKSELPESVMKTIKTDFPGYKISEPEQVEKPGFNGYEVELEKGEQTLEVVFSEAGSVLSKTTVEEGAEDKD